LISAAEIAIQSQCSKGQQQGPMLSSNGREAGGCFFSGTTIWGGHIYVQGRALDIGDGVATTKVIGTYIDVGRGGGVFMSYGARNLTMVGISLDLSPMAKKAGAKKLTVPRDSIDSVKRTRDGPEA
jgi:hypothetical protein